MAKTENVQQKKIKKEDLDRISFTFYFAYNPARWKSRNPVSGLVIRDNRVSDEHPSH